jgi:hypothetical protein
MNPDQYAGQGGSYTLDPETGLRTLVERTQDPAQEPATEPEAPAEQIPAQE